MEHLNNNIIEFDFFKSFEKPQNSQQIKRSKFFNNYIIPTFFLLGCGTVISFGMSMYEKQNEIHKIIYEEDQKIAQKINQFVVKDSNNKFVANNYNECSKVMYGTGQNIENQCMSYVYHHAHNAPKELKVDMNKLPQSLLEFKNLSQRSPESIKKLNQLFSDLGVKIKD